MRALTLLLLITCSAINFTHAFEVSSGKGVVSGTAERLRDSTRVTKTTWLDVKSALTKGSVYGGFQVGLHQSDDFIHRFACSNFRSIAGYRYCSLSEWSSVEGMQYLALYAGFNTDLISLIEGVQRPLRVYVGAGASRLQTYAFSPTLVPYSTFEVNYSLAQKFQAKAAIFVSQLKDNEGVGISFPGISVQYLF